MSHSPGPWRWGEYDDQDLVNEDKLCQQNGSPMGFYDESGLRGDPTHETNRALIASAPELLALLRELEWAGSMAEHYRSDICCPECQGPNPRRGDPGKHEPDCRLGSLLDKLGRE